MESAFLARFILVFHSYILLSYVVNKNLCVLNMVLIKKCMFSSLQYKRTSCGLIRNLQAVRVSKTSHASFLFLLSLSLFLSLSLSLSLEIGRAHV